MGKGNEGMKVNGEEEKGPGEVNVLITLILSSVRMSVISLRVCLLVAQKMKKTTEQKLM